MRIVSIAAVIIVSGFTSANAAECRLTGTTQKVPVWKDEASMEKAEEERRAGASGIAIGHYAECIVDPGTRAEISGDNGRVRDITVLEGFRTGCRGTVTVDACVTQAAADAPRGGIGLGIAGGLTASGASNFICDEKVRAAFDDETDLEDTEISGTISEIREREDGPPGFSIADECGSVIVYPTALPEECRVNSRITFQAFASAGDIANAHDYDEDLGLQVREGSIACK
jgi:hypothetical protein